MSQDSTTLAPARPPLAGHPPVQVHRVVREGDTAGSASIIPFIVRDVLVRDYFGDTGSIPTYGVISHSPDIIPYGSGTLDIATAISTYNGPSLTRPVVLPGSNNIYVRAKNLFEGGTESGTVALYYCASSLFMLPAEWKQNQLKTADGDSSVSFVNQSGSTVFSYGDILLTQEAFYLTSLQDPPAGQHYCLIAVVNTPNTPVSIPSTFNSTADFIQWVANTPAVAWHNITVVPNSVQQILETMVFGSADPEPNMFHFTLMGRNLPAGTTVVVQCTDAGCPIDETLTFGPAERNGTQYAGFDQLVPGEFQSAITVTVTPPAGESFPAGASVAVFYWEYPPMEMTDQHHQVGRFAQVARTAPDGTRQVVSQFVLPVGQCTIDIVAD